MTGCLGRRWQGLGAAPVGSSAAAMPARRARAIAYHFSGSPALKTMRVEDRHALCSDPISIEIRGPAKWCARRAAHTLPRASEAPGEPPASPSSRRAGRRAGPAHVEHRSALLQT